MTGSTKKDRVAPKTPLTSAALDDKPSLDRIVQAEIGDKLRSMYGELVEQPLPDKLAAIIDRLARGS